jgi:hypothetical protein
VRLLVSLGDLYLTGGDVDAASDMYQAALSEGQSTSEDAITEVLRTPVQVALSAAHRGLAWCALAKQGPTALAVATKQLKQAIAACKFWPHCFIALAGVPGTLLSGIDLPMCEMLQHLETICQWHYWHPCCQWVCRLYRMLALCPGVVQIS